MYPGKMNLPLQSITRAPFGAVIVFASPAAAILLPSTTIVAFWTICEVPGLISVPLTNAIVSACAVSAKIDNATASAALNFIGKRFTFDFSQCKLSRLSLGMRAGSALPKRSLLSFYQGRCFTIDRGVIRLARSQIKFVDGNLDKRRNGNGQDGADETEQGCGCEGKEQDVDRVQSHFFAKHERNQQVCFDLLDK